ncbi:hypothetical protein [Thermococcus sp.]
MPRMEEEILKLLTALRGRTPLTPEKRVRDFQLKVQRIKNGEPAELEGFLLLRKPPHAPDDAVYYILSPLQPSDLQKASTTSYLILRITENSRISGSVRSGSYVRVSGFMDSYPYGTLRMLNVAELRGGDYSEYWLQYDEIALSKKEFENLFMDTIYASYDFEKAFLYSLFASPRIVGSNRKWGEGVTFSTFKDRDRIVLSIWEAVKYITGLFPRELSLRKEKRWHFVDEHLDLDFVAYLPETPVRYYSPFSRTVLKNEIPAPKWAFRYFKSKDAVFLTPKKAKILPDDPLAYLSEVPFILNEPVGYEKNRELEQLIPNVIATIFKERAKMASMSLGDRELRIFRERFEDWIMKNRMEYGEKFDALRLSGMLFETNTRFLLSTHLLGSMARFEGGLRRSTISDVLIINQEILDTWMNEIPPDILMKAVKDYERYISGDRRANIALGIFMDLEATSADGSVSREEFHSALIRYGFKGGDAAKIIERLLREGYLYEPFAGRLRMIK